LDAISEICMERPARVAVAGKRSAAYGSARVYAGRRPDVRE
jgi:hypothetical protein